MTRRTLLQALATLAAVVLLAPATAHAGWRVERATEIARVVWHNPNVDRMTIQWALPPDNIPDASAWTYVTDSVVWIRSDTPLEWEPFCTVVLHEAGHLAGMGHSDHGIMVESQLVVRDETRMNGRTTVTWFGTDPRCRDAGLPFLAAH